ncbi:hypothetical protein GW17_00003473 [Ensete ventricosum]|nr:hypothetical protein GW17_00003473 [Ensete ventricosum]
MGERGLVSRLLCPKFGGYLTFGTLGVGKESAPGQPTISDLLNVYNIRQIGADTKIFGIVGKPVGHSKSPVLLNAAFKSAGFDAVYVPLLVDDLVSFLNAYSSTDFAGFSCTIPHKEAAVRCCDKVDPVAKVRNFIPSLSVNLQQALGSYSVVFDAVYTPKVTRLLREAEESGATVVSGLEMFIRQAMGQFELFTNLTAPENLMRDTVMRYT